jgi:4a-hydroxytetrahydrobiopterin dehydratase
MAQTVLAPPQLDEEVARLDGWAVDDGTLHKVVECADFSEAFGFMARVALAAEAMDHHPDWSNSWNKVDIRVVNHAAGGITEACIELAAKIDAVTPS